MTERPAVRPGVLALAIALGGTASAGCIDAFQPEVGAPLAAECNDADRDPGADVSFTRDVEPIFDAHCAGCHYPDARTPIGVQVGGFDLSSYARLRAGGSVRGEQEVVPGRPCASGLVQKVSQFPPFGARMPLNGPPFLTDAEIQLLHDWIAEGALEN